MDPNLKSTDRTQDGLKRSPEKDKKTAPREIKDDAIGGARAGGAAGTGGVSTTSVGQTHASKSPLTER